MTTQSPLGTGFTAASTASEVVGRADLSGRTAIVTGGYSGLGLETVRVLAARGARVVVPARDLARARARLDTIGNAEVVAMDLLDSDSIGAFSERFNAAGQPLHIVVTSAGIMASPLSRDPRGHEAHWATNHLGHFQLVTQLLPSLRRAQGARVVSVSSRGHRYSDVVWEDPDFQARAYERWAAYGQSKTANILFAVALDQRERTHGIGAFAVHPGTIVGTGLEKHLSHDELLAGGVITANGEPILDPSRQMKTVAQGAATQVWCAVSEQLAGLGGVYCEDVDIAGFMDAQGRVEMAGANALRGVMPYAVDPAQAQRLWQLSERHLERGAPAPHTPT